MQMSLFLFTNLCWLAMPLPAQDLLEEHYGPYANEYLEELGIEQSVLEENVATSLVLLSTREGLPGGSYSSGILYEHPDPQKWYIITNVHVLIGADRLRVQRLDENAYDNLKVVATADDVDLALLEYTPSLDTNKAMKGAQLGESLTVGERVAAAPHRHHLITATREGIISKAPIGKVVQVGFSPGSMGETVEIQMVINYGFSGSMLIDSQGKVRGVIRGAGSGYAYALDVSEVHTLLKIKPKEPPLTVSEWNGSRQDQWIYRYYRATDGVADTGTFARLYQLQTLHEERDDFYPLHYHLANELIKIGQQMDYAESAFSFLQPALEHLEYLNEHQPSSLQVLHTLASAYYLTEQADKSRELCEAIIAAYPDRCQPTRDLLDHIDKH